MGLSVNSPTPGTVLMSEQHESMAALVASGISYRQAAEMVGWQADSGWRVMQAPDMQERVRCLAADPEGVIRHGILADLMMVRRRLRAGDCNSEERATLQLRITACMSEAKLRGFIVDRKQIDKRVVDLSLVSSDDLQEHLAAALDVLEPGARRQIEERLGFIKARTNKGGTRPGAGRKPAITATAERLT